MTLECNIIFPSENNMAFFTSLNAHVQLFQCFSPFYTICGFDLQQAKWQTFTKANWFEQSQLMRWKRHPKKIDRQSLAVERGTWPSRLPVLSHKSESARERLDESQKGIEADMLRNVLLCAQFCMLNTQSSTCSTHEKGFEKNDWPVAWPSAQLAFSVSGLENNAAHKPTSDIAELAPKSIWAAR